MDGRSQYLTLESTLQTRTAADSMQLTYDNAPFDSPRTRMSSPTVQQKALSGVCQLGSLVRMHRFCEPPLYVVEPRVNEVSFVPLLPLDGISRFPSLLWTVAGASTCCGQTALSWRGPGFAAPGPARLSTFQQWAALLPGLACFAWSSVDLCRIGRWTLLEGQKRDVNRTNHQIAGEGSAEDAKAFQELIRDCKLDTQGALTSSWILLTLVTNSAADFQHTCRESALRGYMI